MAAWLARDEVVDRVKALLAGYGGWAAARGDRAKATQPADRLMFAASGQAWCRDRSCQAT